ncbi:MAG: Rpn family recombination-promoting nuclease/putative transposase [Bacteroidota bacterium]
MRAKYINPYTDFGFKKLFGEEANKDLLIDFLNQLMPENQQIATLDFRNTENLNDLPEYRKAIFDLNCISENGERFIVEMQKAKIKFFKDRALFYTTFPIKEQSEKGDWNFELNRIYYIALLDFFYDVNEEKAKVKREVQLKDQDCELFFDKLKYIFLQMPAFKKQEQELETRYDKWLYFLKNLEDFNEIPAILKEPIFEKAFQTAEIANFNAQQLELYQKSLLAYRDLVNMINTKYEEGYEQGIEQGIKKVALRCLKQGMTIGETAAITELSIEEVTALQRLI